MLSSRGAIDGQSQQPNASARSLDATVLDWIPASGSAEARRFPELGKPRLPDGTRARAGSRSPGLGRGSTPRHFAGLRFGGPGADLQFYLDLVVMPLLLRALFGERLTSFRTEIGARVASANG